MNYFILRSFYKYFHHNTYLNRAALCRQYRQPQRCTSKTLDGYNWIYKSDFHASFYRSSIFVKDTEIGHLTFSYNVPEETKSKLF